MDVKTVKEQIAESLLVEKYQEKVVPTDELKVTDKEIQEYYDQVNAIKRSWTGTPATSRS